VTIRVEPAGPEDARAVAAVHVRAWQAAYAGFVPAAYLASLSVDQRETIWRDAIAAREAELMVARDADADAVLGWISFGACRDRGAGPRDGEVWALYVDPGAWARGVGRTLWGHALPRLRARGFKRATLWVFPQNARAIRFYQSLGFQLEPGSEQTFELGGATMAEVRCVLNL
jgi:ribosomal protein S18 acetylase RimI-like enzyme